MTNAMSCRPEGHVWKVGDKATREDGRKVEIIAERKTTTGRTLVTFVDFGEEQEIQVYYPNGRVYRNSSSRADLLPPDNILWANVYKDGLGAHESREYIDANAHGRIGVLEINLTRKEVKWLK